MMDERELLKRLDLLPRELEPDNDPWERIAARLETRAAVGAPRRSIHAGRSAWAGWRTVAAAAAILVVLATWMHEPEQTPGANSAPIIEAADANGRGPAPIPAGVAGAQAEYFAAFREFKPLGASRERLADPTLEQIESSWSELQRVESALEEALASSPNDPFLNRRMLELRSRQLGFFRQLAALDHSNWRLTI